MKFRIVFLFVLILGCTEQKTSTDSLLSFLPNDAALIIKINDLTGFKSEFKNNGFFNKIQKTALFGAIKKKTSALAYLAGQSKGILGFYELGKDNYEYLLIADNTPELLATSETTDKLIETFTYQNNPITKFNLDGHEVFTAPLNGKIVLGSSLILVENALRVGQNSNVPHVLQKIFSTADKSKSLNIFLNVKSCGPLLGTQLKIESNLDMTGFADWVSIDFLANQNEISLSGITMANDSVKNFVNLFKGTLPIAERTSNLAPINSNALLSFTFDNYSKFTDNQKKFLDKAIKPDTLFNTIEEVGIIYLNGKKAVILNSYGADNLLEGLKKISKATNDYQGSPVAILENNDLINEAFEPLVTNFNSNFYTVIENAFVFTSDQETLQNIVANSKSGATFNNTDAYRTAKAQLANEASILFVSNDQGIEQVLETDFTAQLLRDVKNAKFDNYVFAGQLVADQNFYHTSSFVSEVKTEISNNTVAPLYTVTLDTDLVTDPQFVKNHRTGKQEIVVQDQDNYLHLISTDGKVLWKKQLDGKIRGKVHQVDIYKNGKLQLAFCTNNQFLILDRNGKEVPPFNKKFEGGNLNPLAVFDYDNNKNYRFVITQGRKIFMYNGQGKVVSAFTYKEAQSAIIAAPQHFRVAKKDYLLFKLENGTLKIRHRAGQDRIKVGAKIDFSNNDIYLYKNKFSLTDKSGVLHQIDTKGKLTKTNFNLSKDHGMFATSKTLALMDDTVLSIKGKKVTLELGVYTAPKIFYIYDKIYVAVTDLQSQKIYLFDSQAKPIANFPVFGNSIIDLIDMDGDKKLELVAKDQENSLIVYKLN
ncbi:MAG: ribonuclease HII [Croceitalea sp.]|nr:ribonuclease HII [Croceitalea sp.]